ncbi:MAG: DUF6518 family protein [Acidimicrobiales bacterium]
MSRPQQLRRVVVVGLASFVVGALDSLIKGQGTGLLGALSQIAAPWFLLAFLAGAATSDRRYILGALSGFGATVCALAGFYFVDSFIFAYGTWPESLHFALGSGKVYFELGFVSGPLFGWCGAWWKRYLSIVPVVLLGLAFVAEALIRAPQGAIFYQYAGKVAMIEAVTGALWITIAFYLTLALRHRDRLEETGQTVSS